ncbi:type II toxin-antitoxin system RelE/ParE family toxin [Bizionia myxarmorum]|uniref:Type II toxin-antitoxin system RelE/ParE family toxin n=1 Tax=Bizionia myxarmorum TaxID=291186 RepID=A0A5D0RDU7_9FLAO|nr:type II toxin-antitoxin system RelE/ParE family toxin [Bizionia myxarmorum]TYB79121.1 hypothetical protein ES674_04930 [Bizionia myxarmorum]
MVARYVDFTDEARVEFHRAKCFMEFNGQENEFWSDVEKHIELIKEFPDAFQIRYKNIRIVFLEKFNYSIHYEVQPNSILVYRFLNQSQDF